MKETQPKQSESQSLFNHKQKLDNKPIFVNPLQFVQKRAQPIKKINHNYQPSNLLVDLSEEKANEKGKKIIKSTKIKHYKTRMCPDGRQCKRQFVCHFAHNQNQLRKPFIKRTQPCIRYQKGLCNLGSVCRLYHGNIQLKKKYLYKQTLCAQFIEKGYCGKGKLCIFIHPQSQNKNQLQQKNQIQQKDNNIINAIQTLNQKTEQKVNKQHVERAEYQKQENQNIKQVDEFQQKKKAKQVVQIIEQKIGEGQVIQQDQGFNINFAF